MAYQTLVFYNLGAAVGRDAPNHFSDVMLIEALLGILGRGWSMANWKEMAKQGGVEGFANVTEPPKITGRFKPELQAWIDVFLLFDKKTARDGRIDPVKDERGSIGVERGGRTTSLYNLSRNAAFTNASEYMKIGDRLGLKVNLGDKGISLTRLFA